MSPRLSLALSEGALSLPETGRIAVFGASPDADLSALPRARCQIVTPLRPAYDHWRAQGYECGTDPAGPFACSIVFLPRAKAAARAVIAQAMALTSGPVLIDGAKTDGIDSLLKEVRKRLPVSGSLSKAHGKLFWLPADPAAFSDWVARPSQIDGFTTLPGVFSADGVDPASALLASALPARLGAHVADLGAGWGYLSSAILSRGDLAALHLVEADEVALRCARLNVTDPRARFHWADARHWQPPEPLDTVVMNPPFHTGRSGDPGLGQAFITSASAMLKPSGQLWMVANRHLPYEDTLAQSFREITEPSGDSRFKLIHAARPTRRRA
ncbi:class I SAM-dependent methyltransferase [Thalassococcus sp. S3]|uniref:class I SAM-dependent methyltransferase n=1 Tax=Thalassococcus sp. S3 TaxID=2017482 RepID=UPI001023FFE9|nr:methyltransferase [Thalassococcus sp. S3]QBF30339.1 MFS transporter [Thalassococcus sp. S3]